MIRTYLSLLMARQALLSNKARSFLTMLGIIIGIAAIVIIIAVGNGAQSLIFNQINTLGSNLIGVLPGGSDDNGPPATAFGITITTLTPGDGEAIMKDVPGLIAYSGYVKGIGTISWQDQSIDGNFTGVSPSYPVVENTGVASGSFFTDDDNATLSRVAVLGSQVADELFNGANPIGEKIKIKRETFRVIGVMPKRGTVAFQNQDDQVFIPLETAQKILLGIHHLGFMRIKAAEGQNLDILTDEIRKTLRVQHNITNPAQDDFSVRTTAQALSVLGTITNVVKYFLAAISMLSLLVGGIGIMNIMLVAVLERTREIGIRKALGARPQDLRTQFITETLLITLTGGMLGLAIGTLVSFAVAAVAQALGYAWSFSIGIPAVALSFIFPLAVGFLFGYYPAKQAADLKPIVALHYE